MLVSLHWKRSLKPISLILRNQKLKKKIKNKKLKTLQKMKQTLEGSNNGDNKEENEALAIWDCGSPLYDSYELVSLNHLIERHLMALPSLGGSRRFISQFSHPSRGVININPSTTVDLGSTKVAKWSSMVACLSEFVGSKVWKKRVFGERKDKVKKLKLRPLGSCSNIGFGRK